MCDEPHEEDGCVLDGLGIEEVVFCMVGRDSGYRVVSHAMLRW